MAETIRDNTERPIFLEQGTNILVGRDTARMRREVEGPLQEMRKILWKFRYGMATPNALGPFIAALATN